MVENKTGDRQQSGKIGVLLVNLGSPQATDYWSLRRYLRQFLTDSRVIETSRLIWYPILYTLILSKRPQKSGEKYSRIWNYVRSEPPLITITRAQAEKLQQRLELSLQASSAIEHFPKSGNRFLDKKCGKNKELEQIGDSIKSHSAIEVRWAMRYGHPSMETRIREMVENGCTKLLLYPLYPQYCAATTASTLDACFRALKKHRFVPALRTVPSYPDHPSYIKALSSSIRQQFARLAFVPQVLLVSYHGLPGSYVKRGDPYLQECVRTTQALASSLDLKETRIVMSFQSRFGREEWLQPYTDELVIKLARDGVRNLTIVTPGFVADCLETVDEIGHEVARLFRAHGGINFAHIAGLNDSEAGMEVLENVVRGELFGWL